MRFPGGQVRSGNTRTHRIYGSVCLLDVLDYLNAFDWLCRLIETLRLITELGFGPEPTQQRESEMKKWDACLKLFIRTFPVSRLPARDGTKQLFGQNTSFLNPNLLGSRVL